MNLSPSVGLLCLWHSHAEVFPARIFGANNLSCSGAKNQALQHDNVSIVHWCCRCRSLLLLLTYLIWLLVTFFVTPKIKFGLKEFIDPKFRSTLNSQIYVPVVTKNRRNSGVYDDQATKLGIFTHKGNCLHLSHAHYFVCNRTSMKCLIAPCICKLDSCFTPSSSLYNKPDSPHPYPNSELNYTQCYHYSYLTLGTN